MMSSTENNTSQQEATSIELPTLQNNNDNNNDDGDDDAYHNAIMGRNTYPTATSTQIITNPKQTIVTASQPKLQSNIPGASFNLINSIVGAGIIGIPYALRQSGLIAGLFLLLLVGYLTDKSLRIIVGLASFHPALKSAHVKTFEDLASYPFGNVGYTFIMTSMFVMAYGAMVAYLLIVKDTVPHILGVYDGWERVLIMVGTSLVIMLPLSIQRDMASLAITSLISIIADVILVIFIAAYAPIQERLQNNPDWKSILGIKPTLFIGLGILSTAMACQHSAFIVSGSLKNKTMARWSTVTKYSISIATILCMILGTTGYLGFLDETQGDVLNNFDKESMIANVARGLLAITMFLTYPMEMFVARHVLVMLLHDGDLDGLDDPNHTGQEGFEGGGFLCFNRRQGLTFGLYLLTLLPALFVDDLGPVLSITGSLGGGCLSYIAPGMCFLGVNGDAFLSFAYGLLPRKKNPDQSLTTNANLPLEGDANQIAVTETDATTGHLDLPVAGTRVNSILTINHDEKKPFWWYLALFPVWCSIATIGKRNMEKKLSSIPSTTIRSDSEEYYTPQSSIEESPSSYHIHSTPPNSPIRDYWKNPIDENSQSVMPTPCEFMISFFFILFGIVAVIAGVTSNIWIQVRKE